MADHRRKGGYKTCGRGRDPEESRRRRAEDIVELRKAKRDRDLVRRRRISEEDSLDIDVGPRPDDAAIQDKLQQISMLLNSGNRKETLQGLVLARHMVDDTSHVPLIPELIGSGLVPVCIQYLRSPDEILRFEAANIIINITWDKFEYVVYVMELGVLPLLYDALNSKGRRTVARVLWAMGNIAGDNIPVRDKLIQDGIVDIFLQLGTMPLPPVGTGGENGRRATLELLRCVCWVAGRILKGRPPPSDDTVTRLIPLICHFYGQDDQELLKYSLMTIQNVMKCGRRYAEIVLNQQDLILPRILFLLTSEDLEVVRACISILRQVVLCGTDEQVIALVQSGHLLDSLKNTLWCEDFQVVKDSVTIIGDLVLEPTPQEVIQELVRLGVVPKLMNLIGMASEGLRSEIIATLTNISVRCTVAEIMYLHAYEVCRAFCSGLRSRNLNIVCDSLDGIKIILQTTQPHSDEFTKIKETVEECRGLEAIEAFQSDQNEKISETAGVILDDFFSETDATDYTADMDSTEGPQAQPPRAFVANFRAPPPALQLFPTMPPASLNDALPSPFLTPGAGLFAFTPATPNPASRFTFDDSHTN